MYKLSVKEAEEPEIKFPTFVGSWRKQGNFRKTTISALLTMLKPLTVWIIKAGKFLKRREYSRYHLTCLLRNLYVVKKQQLEPDLKKLTGSKLGKKKAKTVYWHPKFI